MDTRILHTGLYTANSEKFFNVFFDYIRRCYSNKISKNGSNVKVTTNPDGEVVLEANISRYGYRTIWDKNPGNDRKIREWIAIKIKEGVRKEFTSDIIWSRFNDDDKHAVDFLSWYDDNSVKHSFTIAEAYFIYDILLNRKNVNSRYADHIPEKFVGQQKDPLKTEMERIRREKIAEAEKKYTEEKSRIYNEEQEKIRNAREKFDAEAQEEFRKAKLAYEAELAAIENKVTSVNKVGSLFADFAA